jgi:predicted HTH domain antitoxin
MSIVIPNKVLEASGLSEEELLQEVVLMLFEITKVSSIKTNLPRHEFMED